MTKKTKRIIKTGVIVFVVAPVVIAGVGLLALNAISKEPSSNDIHNYISDFLKNHIPKEGSPNTLFDIDDLDLIDLNMDDKDFRKEYGVSDSEYERWKLEVL